MTAYAIMVWIFCDTATGGLPIFSKLSWIGINILLLAPVPWGRYALGDHSPSQCVAGCVGGVFCGIVAFVLWHHLFFTTTTTTTKG